MFISSRFIRIFAHQCISGPDSGLKVLRLHEIVSQSLMDVSLAALFLNYKYMSERKRPPLYVRWLLFS